MPKSRRHKRLVISGGTLAAFFKTDNLIIVGDGVPQDARLVRIYPDPEKDEIHLIYESDSFAEVLGGNKIPRLDVDVEIREAQTSWTSNPS